MGFGSLCEKGQRRVSGSKPARTSETVKAVIGAPSFSPYGNGRGHHSAYPESRTTTKRLCERRRLRLAGRLWRRDVPSMSAKTDNIPKFQHVTIIFPPGQEETLRRFYIDVLNFREKPIPKVVKPLGWIWFYTGEEGIELHCVPDQKSVPQDWAPHFCIEVGDLDRYRESLKRGGYEVIETRTLPFRPRFFTRDPFSNLIEIVHVEGDYLAAGE
jgi:catechol 2,3-dioxygenase-like lactoylglutathione lyase family enzyme